MLTHILIIGNPVDGFKYIGPLTYDDALRIGEQSGEADWWVSTLYKEADLEQPISAA